MVVNLDDPAFKQCLSLLESKLDEEKFVGILLVKNIIQPDDYQALDKVYQSLGLEFIYRLLQSKDNKAEESISYINLSVTLLLTFITLEYPTKDTNTTVAQRILNDPLISDLLHLILVRCTSNNTIENINFIKESIQILTFLCSNTNAGVEVIKLLIQQENIQLIGELLIGLHNNNNNNNKNNNNSDEENLKLLKLYIDFLYLLTWRCSNYTMGYNKNSSGINNNTTIQILNQINRFIGPIFELLEPLSIVFKERVDEIKFSLLPILVTIIQVQTSNDGIVIHSTSHLSSSNWRYNLKYAIFTILSSKKLSNEYRDNTIVLLSVLLDFTGHSLFTLVNTKSPTTDLVPLETFLLLSLQWSRTEIHVILLDYEKDSKLSQERSNVLTSAYRIIEHVIEFLGHTLDESESLDTQVTASTFSLDTLEKMKSIMVDSMAVVINYVTQASEEYPEIKPAPEMIDAFRLLGLWLSEEAASVTGPLQKSLPFIMNYALKHCDELGYFLCFLFPGLTLYLETPSNVERFTEQNGFVIVSNYLNLYLADLIHYIKDTNLITNGISSTTSSNSNTTNTIITATNTVGNSNNSNNGSGSINPSSDNNNSNTILKYNTFLQQMKSYGVTPNTIVNVILPRVSEVLQVYFSDTFKNKSISNSNQLTRNSFIGLVPLISEQISVIIKELDISYWDTYLINQYVISNLITLALSVLTHYEEKDFTDTESLNKLFSNMVQFYGCIEIPSNNLNGNNNDNRYESLWATIREYYIIGIELILQNVDKYPLLSNNLINKRWPPNDFQLQISTSNQKSNYLGVDDQIIINVNRNIRNLIRKLIELKSK